MTWSSTEVAIYYVSAINATAPQDPTRYLDELWPIHTSSSAAYMMDDGDHGGSLVAGCRDEQVSMN
jgi:hypothetical protein